MKEPRPLWMGVPRGTPIVSMAALSPIGDGPEDPGFFARLRHRLTHLVGGGTAAVIGFFVIEGPLVSIPYAVAHAGQPLALVVAAALPAVAWACLCAAAGLAAFSRRDQAPAWARALVAFLVIVGKVTVVTFVVVTFVVLATIVVGMMLGIASAGRER